MSKNRVLLSVITVVAIAFMASETATAQLLQGRILGRRGNDCCAPAPAPAPCCSTPAPRVRIIQQVRTRIAKPANCCPAPAPSCGCATPAVAPVMAAPAVSAPTSCCGGSVVTAPMMNNSVVTEMPMETGVVMGEAVQTSPSDTVDSTVTGAVIDPPAAAPAEDN